MLPGVTPVLPGVTPALSVCCWRGGGSSWLHTGQGPCCREHCDVFCVSVHAHSLPAGCEPGSGTAGSGGSGALLWVSFHCPAPSPAWFHVCLFVFKINLFMVPLHSGTTDWLQPQIPTQGSGLCRPSSKAAALRQIQSLPLGLGGCPGLLMSYRCEGAGRFCLPASPDWQSQGGTGLGSATGLQTPRRSAVPRQPRWASRSQCGSSLASHSRRKPPVDTAAIPPL